MTAFAITYDYLCPFARNANETVVEALQAGAAYDVTFRPFSLTQNHATEQDIPVWERDLTDPGSGVLAHQFGLAIRDEFPTSFLRFHPAMFAARHDAGRDINDVTVVRDVVASIGLDPDEVGAVVASGRPAKTLEVEHTALVEDHAVF
ncbi:MAG: DsbA family protein, partial [Acidimicrobiia bacterium]|nr:DsbA family protein [Acidimicrobiia bacterium]